MVPLSITRIWLVAGLLSSVAALNVSAQALLDVDADDSVVRHYAFDRESDVVSDLSHHDRTGMVITHRPPYYDHELQLPKNLDYPRWTQGRWEGKPALMFRSAGDNVRESQFFRTDTDTLVLEAWIRLHSPMDANARASLFSIGRGVGSGWDISATDQATTVRLGRSKPEGGDVLLQAQPLSQNVWHQLVAEIRAHEVRLYVDGELAAETTFEGSYAQPPAPSGRTATYSEESWAGLKIGAPAYVENTLFFDVGELVIYDEPLAAGTIASHYTTGKPGESAESQQQAHRAYLEAQARLDSIEIAIPTKTYGYFTRGESVPLTVRIPDTAQVGKGAVVEASLRQLNGAEVFEASKPMPADGELVWEIPFPEKCELYTLLVRINDAEGKRVVEKTFEVATIVPVAPMSERPSTSPLGGHEIFTRHIEDLALGGQIERHIPYLAKAPGTLSPNFSSRLDARVDKQEEAGLDILLTIGPYYDPPGVTPTEQPKWEDWCRAIVERYKGRVKYWEIINEPNAGHMSPAEYVEYLKTAHDIIREVDPEAKIVGLCGVTSYPEWTEDVLAAGGAGYFDILSFHNYIGDAPISDWKRLHKVERTREIVRRYLGKDVPMWNTESGIHQPRRKDGRPLTDDQLLEQFPRGHRQKEGIALASAHAITMTTERVSACWQVQSILLDRALGVEKWFMLMGSSVFYPHAGASAGVPSLKGIAYAALAEVVTTMESAELIPISVSSAAGVLITDQDGSHTAALFSDTASTRSFVVEHNGVYQGMDYLGNPLSWEARDNLLTVTMGMAPVYIFGVPASFHEAPFLDFADLPAMISPGDTVEGSVLVRNLYNKPLSGQLRIEAGGSTLQYEPAINLAANQQVRVPFTLKAGALDRGEHALSAQLLVDGGELSSTEGNFDSEGVARGIPLMTSAFSLDADPAEWADIPAEIADNATKVVLGRPPVGFYDPASWQGPEDLSFTVQTAWQPDEGILFFIRVRDDKYAPVGEENLNRAFLQDALELFFDGRALSDQTAVYSPGVEQFVVVPPVESAVGPARVRSYGRYDDTVEVEAVGARTDDGYVLEGRIFPLANADFFLEPGTRLGMDFVLDDAADEPLSRKVQMALHGTAMNSRDTTAFGRYYLMGDETQSSENLLQNSALTSGPDGELTAWTFEDQSKPEAGSVEHGVSTLEGTPALWITSSTPSQVQCWWVQTLPVTGGGAYELSYRLMGELEGTARWANGGVGVFFLDAQGKWLDWQRMDTVSATGAWGSYSNRFIAPREAARMGFRFTFSSKSIEGAATFYCSDIVLQEVHLAN